MVDSTEMRGTATGTGTGTATGTATEDSHFVVANKNKTKAKPSTFLRRKSQNSETQNWQMREIKRTLEYHKVYRIHEHRLLQIPKYPPLLNVVLLYDRSTIHFFASYSEYISLSNIFFSTWQLCLCALSCLSQGGERGRWRRSGGRPSASRQAPPKGFFHWRRG